jgi:acetolactate synthase-1/2/3 large subunit
LQVTHFKLSETGQTADLLAKAFTASGPVVVEVDMQSWGPFAAKFAGPILKKD